MPFLWLSYRRLISIKSASELFEIFFRLVQIFSAFGLIYFLLFLFPLWLNLSRIGASLEYVNVTWALISLPWSLLQILLAEWALRAVRERRFPGVALGLVLACLMIPSRAFVLGCFGLYCFLNMQFQQKYLVDSPEAFQNLLSALNLNHSKRHDG